MGNEKERKDEEEKTLVNETVVGMAQSEMIQRHGEGASQMMQSYKGVRYDAFGEDLNHQGRSLKDIANYKVNKDYESQNIKQQSGFSAELVKEARDNKEAIKNRDPKRTRTTDGIGNANDQRHDHITVDEYGNVVDGSGSQMKFLKIDSKGRVKVVDEIVQDESWKRYNSIEIPEDQYDKAIKYADDKSAELREQAKNLRDRGNQEKAAEIEERAQKYEDSKKKIKKSNVREDEAINARIDPKQFTIKEVLGDSHKAGLEAAKGAAIVGGGISVGQNIYAVLAHEKSLEDAMLDVADTTIKSGGVAYVVGGAGTGLKSVMHSSKNGLVRKIGTTNAPALIATGVIQIGKSFKRYAENEIDEIELLEELGEKGTSMVAGGMGATLGSAAGTFILPGIGTVVGGFVGSMVAYTLSSVYYNEVLNVLKYLEVSEERRRVLEAIAESSIREMKKYQSALIEYTNSEFDKREESLETLFAGISNSINNDNVDGLFNNINGIGIEFGLDLEFKTFEEFDEAMSDENFILKL